MTYDECYEMIIENFKNKIQTDDKLLKIKIFNNLLLWYKNNFEDSLKLCCSQNNQLGIITIFKKIEDVCKKDDYTKLKITIQDKNYDEFIKLSQEIFSLVVDFNNKKNSNFDEDLYNLYCDKLNNFEHKISPLLIDDYKFMKSECLLDLLYLKNKGNVLNYSLRTSSLLSKK